MEEMITRKAIVKEQNSVAASYQRKTEVDGILQNAFSHKKQIANGESERERKIGRVCGFGEAIDTTL